MSSNPAIQLYADLRLRHERFDAEAKAIQGKLTSMFSTAKMPTVTLGFDAPALQQRLNATMAALKVTPINVPVNFVAGAMPTMPAMAGGNPALTAAAMPGGLMTLMAAQYGAAVGYPSSGVAGGAPGGSGGGGGRSMMGGGFGRYLGAGILLHGGLQAVRGYEEYTAEMTRATGLNDLKAQLSAEKNMQQHVSGSVPILGELAALAADHLQNPHIGLKDVLDIATTGGAGVTARMVGGPSRRAEIARIELETEKAERKDKAMAIIHESFTSLNEKAAAVGKSETEQQDAARAHGYRLFKAGVDKTFEGIDPVDRPMKAIKEAYAAYGRYDQAVGYQQEVGRLKQSRSLNFERDELAASNAGDTDRAARIGLRGEQGSKEMALSEKDPRLARQYVEQVAPLERQKLEDQQNRAREKNAGDSEARIADMAAHADAQVLQSRGEAYKAAADLLKHSVDARVAALERESKAEKDVTKSALLHAQAIGAQAAGEKEVAAFQEAGRFRADLADRSSVREAEVVGLQAQGRNREASKSAIQARYQDELDRIDPSATDAVQRFDAATRTRDSATALRQHHEQIANRSTDIETAEATAHAHGQAGVGNVMTMQAGFRDMERDAFGDSIQLKRVHLYEQAKIAATKRDLTPTARYHDLSAYHDSVQESIGHGSVHTEALELLGKFKGGDGRPDRSRASGAFDASIGDRGDGALGGVDFRPGGKATLDSAAAKLDKVADKLLKGVEVKVIGGR